MVGGGVVPPTARGVYVRTPVFSRFTYGRFTGAPALGVYVFLTYGVVGLAPIPATRGLYALGFGVKVDVVLGAYAGRGEGEVAPIFASPNCALRVTCRFAVVSRFFERTFGPYFLSSCLVISAFWHTFVNKTNPL